MNSTSHMFQAWVYITLFSFYMLKDLLGYFITVQGSSRFMIPLRREFYSYPIVALYGLFSITTFYAVFMSVAFSVFKTMSFSHVGSCIFVADTFFIVFSFPLVLWKIFGYPLFFVYWPANISGIHYFLVWVKLKILSVLNSNDHLSLTAWRRPNLHPTSRYILVVTVFNQVIFSSRSPWMLNSDT